MERLWLGKLKIWLACSKLCDVERVAGERDLTGGTHVFEHKLHVAIKPCRVSTSLIPIFRLGGCGSNRPMEKVATEGAQVFFDRLNLARGETIETNDECRRQVEAALAIARRHQGGHAAGYRRRPAGSVGAPRRQNEAG